MRDGEKREIARQLFDDGYLVGVDSYLITDDYPDEWIYHWSFKTTEEYLECAPDGRLDEESGLYYTEIPMWPVWWEARECLNDFINDHLEEVANLGFIIIYHNDELWGLGINGAGYSFYDHHWVPLATLYGWIEETEDD